MVGIWQQDRWSNGGSRGLVAGVTTTGGASWTIVQRLQDVALHRRHGRERRRLPACDRPVGLVRADGIAYQLSLSFNDVAPPFTTFDFDHALLA